MQKQFLLNLLLTFVWVFLTGNFWFINFVFGFVLGYFILLTLVYQGFIAVQSGQRPGFTAVMMAITSAAVLSNIPVTVNGVGLREQLHVLLLTPLGVPKEAAVAISLLLFGHVLLVSIAGGLLWWRMSRRPARIVEA